MAFLMVGQTIDWSKKMVKTSAKLGNCGKGPWGIGAFRAKSPVGVEALWVHKQG